MLYSPNTAELTTGKRRRTLEAMTKNEAWARRDLKKWETKERALDSATREQMIRIYLSEPEFWEWMGWERVYGEALSRALGEPPWPH